MTSAGGKDRLTMRILKRAAIVIMSAILAVSAFAITASAANGALEIWDGTVAEGFAGGDGTEENPYLISNGSQLAYLMKTVNESEDEKNSTTYGKFYKLTADIYLNDISDYESWDVDNAPENIWTPGGGVFHYDHIGFAGTFDGAGFDVKGVYVNRKEQYNGLFGYLFNADVKNLGVTHSYINGGQYTAGLAGYTRASKRNVTLSGCSVSDTTVIGTSSVGGVFGYLESYNKRTTVEKCSSDASVTARYNSAGGIAGFLALYGISYKLGETKDYAVRISDCVNFGDITAGDGVGGIIGSSQDIVSDAFIYPEDHPDYIPPEKQPRIGVLIERCVNAGRIGGSSKSGTLAGILGPADRDDQFVEIDLVGCYGTKNGTTELYGITRSTLTVKDSSTIEDKLLGTKDTFKGFSFDNVWDIIDARPVIRRLGDTFGKGGVSAEGFFAALELAIGTLGENDVELSNIDFDGDGEFTLSDLNAFINYMRGKGASDKSAS